MFFFSIQFCLKQKTLVFPGEFKSSRLCVCVCVSSGGKQVEKTKQKVLISDTWCGKIILAVFVIFFNVFFHVDERSHFFLYKKTYESKTAVFFQEMPILGILKLFFVGALFGTVV